MNYLHKKINKGIAIMLFAVCISACTVDTDKENIEQQILAALVQDNSLLEVGAMSLINTNNRFASEHRVYQTLDSAVLEFTFFYHNSFDSSLQVLQQKKKYTSNDGIELLNRFKELKQYYRESIAAFWDRMDMQGTIFCVIDRRVAALTKLEEELERNEEAYLLDTDYVKRVFASNHIKEIRLLVAGIENIALRNKVTAINFLTAQKGRSFGNCGDYPVLFWDLPDTLLREHTYTANIWWGTDETYHFEIQVAGDTVANTKRQPILYTIKPDTIGQQYYEISLDLFSTYTPQKHFYTLTKKQTYEVVQ